jgi:hypothetical protein
VWVVAISDALVVAKREGFPAIQLQCEMDRAFGRLRAGIWLVVQTVVAATVACFAAAFVLGHEQPFVASIVAVISVGAVAGQTLRRAAGWIFGIAAGRDLLSIRSSKISFPEQQRSQRRN